MQLPWQQKKKKSNQRNVPQSESRWSGSALLQMNWQRLGMNLLALAVLAGVAAGWLTLMKPTTLPMKQLQVEAPFVHVTRDELYQVMKPVAKGGFFNVDVDAVTDAVESLPWVSSVSVQRVWPDALHVTVREQTALARWHNHSLVSEQGELFTPAVATIPAGLVELQGPDSTVVQVAEVFRVFREILQPAQLEMKRLVLSPRRAWTLELNSGEVVLLGREVVQQRLERFVQFYPQIEGEPAALQQVDMRYPNGFAIQWQKPQA